VFRIYLDSCYRWLVQRGNSLLGHVSVVSVGSVRSSSLKRKRPPIAGRPREDFYFYIKAASSDLPKNIVLLETWILFSVCRNYVPSTMALCQFDFIIQECWLILVIRCRYFPRPPIMCVCVSLSLSLSMCVCVCVCACTHAAKRKLFYNYPVYTRQDRIMYITMLALLYKADRESVLCKCDHLGCGVESARLMPNDSKSSTSAHTFVKDLSNCFSRMLHHTRSLRICASIMVPYW